MSQKKPGIASAGREAESGPKQLANDLKNHFLLAGLLLVEGRFRKSSCAVSLVSVPELARGMFATVPKHLRPKL